MRQDVPVVTKFRIGLTEKHWEDRKAPRIKIGNLSGICLIILKVLSIFNLDFVVPVMMPSVTGTVLPATMLLGICCY